jgi:phospholipid transport system substrate-binding protein
MTMKLRSIIAVIVFSLLPLTAYSVEATHSGTSPESFVQNTSSRVITLLKSHTSDESKQKQLTQMFLQVMDADWIGKFVLGKHWQTLSDDQKRTYLKNYRQYLIDSYVPKFRQYNDQAINVKGIKDLGRGQYLVVTDIVSTSSNTDTKVEYRIQASGGSYRIHDIVAEGVSLLTTQRSEFSSIMSNEGFDALNDRLLSRSNSNDNN